MGECPESMKCQLVSSLIGKVPFDGTSVLILVNFQFSQNDAIPQILHKSHDENREKTKIDDNFLCLLLSFPESPSCTWKRLKIRKNQKAENSPASPLVQANKNL